MKIVHMGLFDIIKKIGLLYGNKKDKSGNSLKAYTDEYTETLSFNCQFDALLQSDKFIARSDYKSFIPKYENLYHFYEALIKSNCLDNYVKNNKLDILQIEKFLRKYDDIKDLQKGSEIIKKHNEKFIAQHLVSEQTYFDEILKECDPAISLDDEQRKVVLSEEDHTLVIAGAGAGKTTTIAAKVKYLVEKRGLEPSQILVISFTNKAVDELRTRINHKLQIPCHISTFHSVGYTILRQSEANRKKIVNESFMYNVINDYLKKIVLRNTEMVDKLVLFFGSYFSAPYEGDNLNEYFQFVANVDNSTIKSNLREYVKQIVNRKTHKAQTLNDEILRSFEEVRIANFLYLNQIEYEYEPIYKYHILDANKPYTPDFRIKQGEKITYIEHFGITEEGKNNRFTQQELDRYKARINDKIRLHRKHNTDLIYTFSSYRDGIDYIQHLRALLLEHKYELKPRPTDEVYKKIISSEENKYISRLVSLICTFISNFKTQGYTSEYFDILNSKTNNVRTKLFLDICKVCFYEYQQALIEHHCIDFEDMINESANLIRKKQIAKERLDYQYIIVDEYQDISKQRYNLISELSKLCNTKIIAVGDDWQSIYAFSGSLLPLFTRFLETVGYGQELKITHTYRNAQEIINIAGEFIQRNSAQIKKELISPKRVTNPIIIYTYREDMVKGKEHEKGGRYFYLGEAVNQAIEDILQYNLVEGISPLPSILLIGRYGFDARNLCYSKEFNYDEKSWKIYSTKFGTHVKLQFLTAHSSKGLSAENVIIINAKDGLYGFPSQIEDDPILNLVVSNDNSYNYAEERRLFYVALTRTKNRVFIITPKKRPSEFIKELLREKALYPNVLLKGELDSNLTSISYKKDCCPQCGHPMQFRWNKNYGLKLWICTNDQEICGFMTNDRRGGNLSIHKCDRCQDGFLVVKNGSRNYFLGCTNYKADGSGCNRMINSEYYDMWINDNFGTEDLSVNMPSYFAKDKEITHPPKMIIKKTSTPMLPHKQSVNMVKFNERIIEKDGFKVMVDADGRLLTDMSLLQKLYELRYSIAKQNKISAFCIMHNTVLARLATDKPTSRDEFIAINGVGPKIYESYGEAFISAIEQHIREELNSH